MKMKSLLVLVLSVGTLANYISTNSTETVEIKEEEPWNPDMIHGNHEWEDINRTEKIEHKREKEDAKI